MLRKQRTGAVALALACATTGACGPAGAGRDGHASPGIGSGAAETGGEESGAGDTGLVDDSSGDSGVAFDLGSAADDGGGGDEEACGAIDFLFVIDNSVSMADEQVALINSFPGFMAEIQENTAAGHNTHVMVADTDEWGLCTSGNGWPGLVPDHHSCNAYIGATMFDECDRTLGAGVLHPAGLDATNAPCSPSGGHRYMVEGEVDPVGTFACMAKVGVAGHYYERTMDSLLAAVAPGINGPGGCNEGFLRDDALLVVVIITDEADGPDDLDEGTSSGDPQTWFDDLVAVKSGDAESIVVVSLVHSALACPPPSPAAAFDGTNIALFTSMFGSNGYVGGICEPDYAPLFADAVDIIDAACDDFQPPG